MFQRQLTFKEAVTRALTVNYCNFSGRSSRSEYWWYVLFTLALNVLVGIVFSFSTTAEATVSGLVTLGLLLPGLGLAVRRLHDIGKSGWWLFIAFIPLIGAILLIVWYCQDSNPFPNAYGPVPNVNSDNDDYVVTSKKL